uniref:Uncharacterized protein n=1 Tax=Dinoroseobacter phage vB_DshS_R26L TaxID=3161158 RepID=A0AAU7VHH7_9CAUD
MLYFTTNTAGDVIEISSKHDYQNDTRPYQTRNDWATMEDAEAVAASATEHAGEEYIAIDCGSHVSPRYDVIRMPQVGDEVSYSFNGDTYPDGKIASISASKKLIMTDTGGKYYRRKQSGSWVKGGTWSLVRGHSYTQNPHF